MGKITPLHDLDYKTVEPLRIYKFSPKYFLTMGEYCRLAWDKIHVLTHGKVSKKQTSTISST